MDYNMMPPPQSSSIPANIAGASVAGDFCGGGSSGHYSSDSTPAQLFNSDATQETPQNVSAFVNGCYKPHFSGRAHVNRPPPLSLPQTYYRDTVSQSPAGHYADHQQSPHCMPASPHHIQSPLVSHSPHLDASTQRVPPSPHLQQGSHMLHRQSSAPHLVQNPHLTQSPHLTNYTGGEMSPRPTSTHLQQTMFSDRTRSPLPLSGSGYEAISSPIHPHKPRHFSETAQSPHTYNVHPTASALHLYNSGAPNPSPHPYSADPSPSPRHYNDPNPSPHQQHFSDPSPSPFNDQGPHRSTYLDSPQPGTPVGAAYSHPGTPAGYVDSPHQHLSPHPTRSTAYQHFFGPNLPLPANSGSSCSNGTDSSTLDIVNSSSGVGQFSQQNSTDSSQQPSGTSALLHGGGQGDTMLSAINLNAQESETVLQDAQSSHAENAMDTEWTSSQKLKSNSTGSGSFTLFDNTTNPPGVDELLSQATDFIANSSTLSLSDGSKEATKLKPRPKGRPSKNMSPRSYGAQCPICAKTFNNSSALAKHKLTHSDERKYVCQLCSKAFKRQDHLNGHMMTHRTKKPFECSFEGCTKSYCDARSLRRHLENHHNVPAETLYDMSLPNFGLNGGGGVANMYQPFPGDTSSPSPHASPSYPSGPGQQYFRFDQGPTNPSGDSQQSFMYSDNPQPAECTICHKRFKNLPALNGHMRLHGGYINIKKPEADSKNSKSDVGDSANLNASVKKQTSRPLQQQSSNNKVGFTTSSSRDSSGSALSLMVHDNKYSMEQNIAVPEHHPMSGLTDDAASQSNVNQNNNQGNVRQGGDGLPVLPTSFISASTQYQRINAQSSSEPPTFPSNSLTNQFAFSPVDQQRHILSELMLTQQFRQMQGSAPQAPFPPLPILSVNPAHSEHFLLEMASRARSDSFHSHMNSPAASKLSEISHEVRVRTTSKDNASAHSALTLLQNDSRDQQNLQDPFLQLDRDDREVSEITSGERPGENSGSESFLANRKRHASAPDKLPNTMAWADAQVSDQQKQLKNEEYAKVQEQLAQPLSTQRRHRRMSADNHHQRGKDYRHSFSHSSSGDLLTQSDGAVLFRSPPPGGVKKRKPRPEPLVIPPNVAAIQSRLRSPRIWEPGENPGVRQTGKTPPPYTPPPILSPMRIGTGLFRGPYWRPPVASGASLSASLPATKISSLQQEPITEEPDQAVEHDDFQTHASTVEPVVIEENSIEPVIEPQLNPPPETDIQPHINIGPEHQATLPALRKNSRDAERDADRATLLWTPECLDHALTVQELTAYMDFSCSAAVPGSGSNKEYALHQLFFNKGDIKRAILCLMSKKISPSFVKFIGDYHYQDSDIWTTEEIALFTDTIMKEDKDFISITRAFNRRKTHKQCIEFYYLWKKICREEYKRLRIIRRKRRHDELYNLRSRGQKSSETAVDAIIAGTQSDDDDSVSQMSEYGEADDEDVPSDAPSSVSTISRALPNQYSCPQQTYLCEYPGCGAIFNIKSALTGHAKIHVLPRPPQSMELMRDQHFPAPKKVKSEPVAPGPGGEEFPCKLCGKVFYKVKSRSAHMKSHSVLAKKAREAVGKLGHQAKQPS
ncbi:zinc finger protein 541-like [Watersipora subatra]|uniref:zinc finger protein 541-like n=1 Tax=Watersipora subatra TaxID=2589382 RepID=UPI00355BC9B2